MSDDSSQQVAQVDAGPPPSIPEMPSVRRTEIYRGRPIFLKESGLRHSIGWQQDRKAGPTFVVARLNRLAPVTIKDRFPLTENGWASAWQALCSLDAGASSALADLLALRQERRRAASALAALDTQALCYLRRVILIDGSSGLPLVKGQPYDVRFQRDRITICSPGVRDAMVEVPYPDVEILEVGGPGLVSKSAGEMLVMILAFGLVGAVLGLIVLGLLGFFLGAVVFGLLGAVIGNASTKIETVVRIRSRDAEFHFQHSQQRPDALRIALSEPLRAIGGARAAQAGDSGGTAGAPSESIPDQLSRLASLLKKGLITRDEFEHLKTKLIAQS